MLLGIRQEESELEKLSDTATELSDVCAESKISVSVQQITSRFQSIQSTAKVKFYNTSLIYHDIIF